MSCALEQSELGTVPVSAVLFCSDKICNEGEKLLGSGAWRLLLLSRSWVSALKDEMVEGMVPVSEVEDRSRSWREAWSDELEERDERGLVSCCELMTLGDILDTDGAERISGLTDSAGGAG